MRLSFLPTILGSQAERKPGSGIIWLKGGETRGWMDYYWPLFGNAMSAWDVKLGIVGLGRKISCHV